MKWRAAVAALVICFGSSGVVASIVPEHQQLFLQDPASTRLDASTPTQFVAFLPQSEQIASFKYCRLAASGGFGSGLIEYFDHDDWHYGERISRLSAPRLLRLAYLVHGHGHIHLAWTPIAGEQDFSSGLLTNTLQCHVPLLFVHFIKGRTKRVKLDNQMDIPGGSLAGILESENRIKDRVVIGKHQVAGNLRVSIQGNPWPIFSDKHFPVEIVGGNGSIGGCLGGRNLLLTGSPQFVSGLLETTGGLPKSAGKPRYDERQLDRR